MDKKFEILEVLPNDLTTSYENGECLIFLELKTLRRDEEKSFSGNFVSDVSAQFKKIIGNAPFLKSVEIYGKVPYITAVGNSKGWVLKLKSGRCICTADRPEKFLEEYLGRY